MKHLLNNISEEEKNSIREQHEGGMNISTENFKQLLEAKSGEVKPYLSEQDNDYYINKELVVTSDFDVNKGESRTIYVKTKPIRWKSNGKIKPGIYAEFSYSENDKRGYYKRLGQEVKFSCDQNYVNIPPITGLNNHPEAAEKFAGVLSNEDNNWVQQYCKKK